MDDLASLWATDAEDMARISGCFRAQGKPMDLIHAEVAQGRADQYRACALDFTRYEPDEDLALRWLDIATEQDRWRAWWAATGRPDAAGWCRGRVRAARQCADELTQHLTETS